MNESSNEPLIVSLARRQLDAYNRSDIDAFCACYHDDVLVLGATGEPVLRGKDAFRAQYAAMFEAHRDVRGDVETRIVLGEHVVELEHWSRVEIATGERRGGTVIVRYTALDGLIGVAEFLRPSV